MFLEFICHLVPVGDVAREGMYKAPSTTFFVGHVCGADVSGLLYVHTHHRGPQGRELYRYLSSDSTSRAHDLPPKQTKVKSDRESEYTIVFCSPRPEV